MSLVRVIIGFLVAPLATSLVFMIVDWPRGYEITFENTCERFLAFTGYGMFAYPAALILGIPTLLLYRRLGWTNPVAFVAGGAAIGFIAGLILIRAATLNYFWCSLSGALSAFVFWMITYWKPYPRLNRAS